MPRYASSIDVARLAGVSQSSVSRTYRPGASISVETRRKVLAAAEHLGYRPSLIPQIMLNHRSYLVALVIGGMYNPFYARVLEEFTVQLHATGHQVLLVHVESGHSLDSVIPRLARYRVDAIVSALAVLSAEAAAALAAFKIPVVSFNTPVKNEWLTSISSDNSAAEPKSPISSSRAAPVLSPMSPARQAARRATTGSRVFATVSPRTVWRLRVMAAKTSATSADATRLSRSCATAGLPRRSSAPTISSRSEQSTRCAAGRSARAGDFLVAGFDDIAMAGWIAYDLTTFVQDARRMVSETVRVLQAAEGAREPLNEIRLVLPARMIERGSTRREPDR